MDNVDDFYNAMHSERIRIVVGKDGAERTFEIPKDILARSGLFPKEMTLTTTAEGPPETVALPDESPVVFSYFFYYSYYFDVRFPDVPVFKPEDSETQRRREQYVHELCQTFVFGDKYNIPGLQNCAVYKLCEILSTRYSEGGSCLTLDSMKYCYENTEPGATLRYLVADHIIRIENRGHATDIDLLSALSVYRGFVRHICDAQRIWDSIQDEVRHSEWFRPKYLKPYRYRERYEIELDVDESAHIPAKSRAIWNAALLKLRCYWCGADGAESDLHTPSRCKNCQRDY